jgi:hypothetical protein
MPTVEAAVSEKIHPFSARLFMPYSLLTDVTISAADFDPASQLMRIWIR